jgi:hypothetical protein
VLHRADVRIRTGAAAGSVGDADVVGVSRWRNVGRAVELVSAAAHGVAGDFLYRRFCAAAHCCSRCWFTCRNRSSSFWRAATTATPSGASSPDFARRWSAPTRSLWWRNSACRACRSGICSPKAARWERCCLWIPFFMGFGVLTVVTLWTPALLRLNGISPSNTAFVVAFNGLGGFLGQSTAGRLMQRFGILPVLVPAFLLGGAATVGLGYGASSVALAATFVGLVGLFMGFGTGGAIGLAAIIYPTPIRSTGVGWGMAMGRFGQIVGPLVAGALLEQRLDRGSHYECHRRSRTDRRGVRGPVLACDTGREPRRAGRRRCRQDTASRLTANPQSRIQDREAKSVWPRPCRPSPRRARPAASPRRPWSRAPSDARSRR